MAHRAVVSCCATALFFALVTLCKCPNAESFLFRGGMTNLFPKQGLRDKDPLRPYESRFHSNLRLQSQVKNSMSLSQSRSTKNTDLMPITSSSDQTSTFYQSLLQRFQGDFDNYKQVVQDRQHGLTPAEGGGHEHIHCTLVPCPLLVSLEHISQMSLDTEQWVLAAFYLNGNPGQIFRFRMYRLIPPQVTEMNMSTEESEITVRLKLHTLCPELDQHLRTCSEQPCTWWNEAYNMWLLRNCPDIDMNSAFQLDLWKRFQSEGLQQLAYPLEGCDVLWSNEWNPSNHSYLYEDDNGTSTDIIVPEKAYHATMEAGPNGVIVDSISMIPGKRILIKDELSLWKDYFWINDRGFDPDARSDEKQEGEHEIEDSRGMPYVYGNRRGIPYKLERVTSMNATKTVCSSVCDYDGSETLLALQREVVNNDLRWTLGEKYRTADVYQQKLNELE
eukprot:CCRYP_014436-RB/>CCRYP_014436-RB protein AED:0.03 eAED:0.03 QI:51/-1/0/1/-1/0/1/0/445